MITRGPCSKHLLECSLGTNMPLFWKKLSAVVSEPDGEEQQHPHCGQLCAQQQTPTDSDPSGKRVRPNPSTKPAQRAARHPSYRTRGQGEGASPSCNLQTFLYPLFYWILTSMSHDKPILQIRKLSLREAMVLLRGRGPFSWSVFASQSRGFPTPAFLLKTCWESEGWVPI